MMSYPVPKRGAWFPTAIGFALVLWGWVSAAGEVTCEPGRSYFGRSNYVEYLAGDLPVVISVPHGGTLTPPAVPDRANGEFTSDMLTEELGRTLYQVLHEQLGHYPHVILFRLVRAKVDCNREIVEGAGNDPGAQQAWRDFHRFIAVARSKVLTNPGRGLYLDLHGQSHAIKRIELGYCLSETQLTNTDAQLNLDSTALIRGSSIRILAGRANAPFATLLRGSCSIGGLLAARGYPAVPSPAMPCPGAGELYFDGGHNVRQYGSAQGEAIDGLQMEVNYAGLRDSAENRARFARALAEVLQVYFRDFYQLDLKAGQSRSSLKP